jgi:hypothetical protein
VQRSNPGSLDASIGRLEGSQAKRNTFSTR